MRTLLLLLTLSFQIQAATYYVATTGNNGADGSIGTPWLTLAFSVSQMSSGDTLNIRGGTYSEQLNNTIPAGTSWNAATTVQAYNGEAVILNPTVVDGTDVLRFTTLATKYIIINGLIIDGENLTGGGNCVKVTYSTPGEPAQFIRLTNCVLKNAYDGMGILMTASVDYTPTFCEVLGCTIYGAGFIGDDTPNKHGVYLSTSSNVIAGNTIFSNLNLGAHLFDGRPSGNVIKNNKFLHSRSGTNGGDGVGIYGGTNNQVYGNVFTGHNVAFIVQPSDFATNNFFINNTVFSNGVAVHVLNSTFLAGKVTILNNLISTLFHTAYGGINIHTDVSSQSLITVSNNVLTGTGQMGQLVDYGAGVTGANNLTNQSSAGFVTPGTDFRLTAGSVAVDAGMTSSFGSPDILGTTRPQGAAWDAGAYELLSGVIGSRGKPPHRIKPRP